MQIDREIRAALIAYTTAHLEWKALPIGTEKMEAKRQRGKLHGKLIELGRLAEVQMKEK